jgi:hypothetical protein
VPQSATPVYRFAGSALLPLEASSDGDRLTSDSGLPWLEQADTALRLCAAAGIPDWRHGRVHHGLVALVRQRSNALREDLEETGEARSRVIPSTISNNKTGADAWSC